MRSTRRPLVVAAILLTMFLSAMEATVVATVMPTIVGELHGFELYGWVASIYMLASTVTIPLWGKLADTWGRKPTMLTGLGLFLVGSVASGASQSMMQLTIWRGMQGLGAGCLQPVSQTLVGDLFTVEERAKVQGVFGAVWGFAAMVGPWLGALILRAIGWRWVFYVNLPFGVLSGLLLMAYYVEPAREKRAGVKLDLAGAALMAVSVLALLLGTSGVMQWVMFPVSLLSLLMFVRVEANAPGAILPLSIFRNRVIVASSVSGLLMGATMMGVLMFVPLFVQAVLGGTPAAAGSSAAPLLLGWPIASALSARWLTRVGYRPLVRWGVVLGGLSLVGTWFALSQHWGVWPLRLMMFAYGIGLGMVNTALMIGVQESAERTQRGIATASALFFRSIGSAVGVGALGAILAHGLAGRVPESVLNALLARGEKQPIDPAVLASVRGAVEESVLRVFLVVAVLGVLTTLSGWLFPDMRVQMRAKSNEGENETASPMVSAEH